MMDIFIILNFGEPGQSLGTRLFDNKAILIVMQLPLPGVVQHVQRSLWRILNGRQHVKLKRRLHSNLLTDFWHRVRPCDVMKLLFQKLFIIVLEYLFHFMRFYEIITNK